MIWFVSKPARITALVSGMALCSGPILPGARGSAQELTYTTVTKAEFGGSLGTMMGMVSGANEPTKETVYLKGSRMRTDDKDASTIVDLGEGRFTSLNHSDKTYYVFTFQQMQEQMEAALQDAAGAAEAPAARPQPQSEEGPEPQFDVEFSTDRTGRTMDFDGYSAEQVLMTVKVVPKGEEGQAEGEDNGSMVLLTELWLSKDLPNYEAIRKVQGEEASSMAEHASQGVSQVMEQAFASDPRMKQAFEENAAKLAELDGIAVRTVTSFVLVPPGQELNREAVLAAADQPLGPGAGDVIAGAAEEGAKDAARSAVRNLTRGLLGRRQEKPEETEAPAPTQTILMRTTSAMEDVSTAHIADSIFEAPADYTEVKPAWMGGGGTETF
jgi:hypothetical protein